MWAAYLAAFQQVGQHVFTGKNYKTFEEFYALLSESKAFKKAFKVAEVADAQRLQALHKSTFDGVIGEATTLSKSTVNRLTTFLPILKSVCFTNGVWNRLYAANKTPEGALSVKQDYTELLLLPEKLKAA